MIKRNILAGLILGVISIAGYAESAHADDKIDCEKPSGNTIEMNICAEKILDESEKLLNQTYKKVMALLTHPDEESIPYSKVKQNLLESQRAWVTFRKKDCDALYYAYSGGTVKDVVYLSCMSQHADKRTEELKGYISYFEV